MFLDDASADMADGALEVPLLLRCIMLLQGQADVCSCTERCWGFIESEFMDVHGSYLIKLQACMENVAQGCLRMHVLLASYLEQAWFGALSLTIPPGIVI